MKKLCVFCCLYILLTTGGFSDTNWWRNLKVGVLPTGPLNAITDVAGIKVGQFTLTNGKNIHTGITAILPHPGNIFQDKVPAAMYAANGFGKLMGFTQVEELGNLETPIILTNTISVPIAAEAVIEYTLRQPGNETVRSVNAVVGETNDGYLNDIRASNITKDHVFQAIRGAKSGPVQEGNIGAGTGTVCFGFKGGIGTSSRKTPKENGGYTVGVLVQSNFGGILQINGAPVGEELEQYYLRDKIEAIHDGSCMIVVATDAPLNSRQLKRLARRAIYGLVRTGGISTHGSGDYVIAFSTANEVRYSYRSDSSTQTTTILRDEALSPLFLAVSEATEEAIYHSLFAAVDLKGRRGEVKALPQDTVKTILRKYNLLEYRN